MKVSGIAALAATLLLGSTVPAHADVADDGQWYIDLYDIPDYHAQGIDGSGVQIAVIDGFINPDAPPLAGANVTIHDDSFCLDETGDSQGSVISDAYPAALHGTNVTAMIAGTGEGPNGTRGIQGIAPGADVHFYGIGNGLNDENSPCFSHGAPRLADAGAEQEQRELVDSLGRAIEAAMAQAISDGADIISISALFETSLDMETLLAEALHHGVLVLTAVTNAGERRSLDEDLALMNGVVGVTSVAKDGYTQLLNADSFGSREEAIDGAFASWQVNPFTDLAAPGIDVLTITGTAWDEQVLSTGTSFATPIAAGNLALAMQANPEATPNQVLQLLIHNTGADSPHEPVFDATNMTGYGYLDTISLLSDEAAQYDDVNPFIDTSNDEEYGPRPLLKQIEAAGQLSSTPDTSPTPTTGGTDKPSSPHNGDDSAQATVIWAIAAAVIVLIGVVIATITIARSRRNS